MVQFADMRAELRHGEPYRRSKAILTPAVIVADAADRGDPDGLAMITTIAERMPGMTGFGPGALRAAARDIQTRVHDDGTEGVLDDAVVRLDGQASVAAFLLACQVSFRAQARDAQAVLAPVARRLGLDQQRAQAIEVLAVKRLSQPGGAS